MTSTDLGRDVFVGSERRRAQNRLAQRRRRQKQTLQKQVTIQENLTIQAGPLEVNLQAGMGLPLPAGISGSGIGDSLSPFAASDLAFSTLFPPWTDSIANLTDLGATDYSSVEPPNPTHVDQMIPPFDCSLETPEAARSYALTFSPCVVRQQYPIFSKDRNEPLIHTAARGNDVNTLRLLKEAGFNVNERDYEGRTALHVALEENRMEALLWLLEVGVDVNAADKQGRTALSMTVNNKCPLGVKLMLTHGAGIAPKLPEPVRTMTMSD